MSVAEPSSLRGHPSSADRLANVRGLWDSLQVFFCAVADRRVLELAGSAPHEPGVAGGEPSACCIAYGLVTGSLAAMARYDLKAVLDVVGAWHEQQQLHAAERSSAAEAPPRQPASERMPAAGGRTNAERAVRESASSSVFCEALLGILAGCPAAPSRRRREPLDRLIERTMEADICRLRSPDRQAAARRRLAVLGGRSELELWTEVRRALSRTSFERLANRLLSELEHHGPGEPAPAVSARAAALAGLYLPACVLLPRGAVSADPHADATPPPAAHGVARPACFGPPADGSVLSSRAGTTAALARASREALTRVHRLLSQKETRPLRRPVCAGLGDGLLQQQLELSAVGPARRGATPALAASYASSITLSRLRSRRGRGLDGGGSGAVEEASTGGGGDGTEPRSAREEEAGELLALERAMMELASAAVGWVCVGGSLQLSRPESWAAPLAVALACGVCRLRARMGERLAGDKEVRLHEEIASRLLRLLSKPHGHRMVALRCLRVQLPVLLQIYSERAPATANRDRAFDAAGMPIHILADVNWPVAAAEASRSVAAAATAVAATAAAATASAEAPAEAAPVAAPFVASAPTVPSGASSADTRPPGTLPPSTATSPPPPAKSIALLDSIFGTRRDGVEALRLELGRLEDCPQLLSQYAELLHAVAAVGEAAARSHPQLILNRVIGRALGANKAARTRTACWGHDTVVALAVLHACLPHGRPADAGDGTGGEGGTNGAGGTVGGGETIASDPSPAAPAAARTAPAAVAACLCSGELEALASGVGSVLRCTGVEIRDEFGRHADPENDFSRVGIVKLQLLCWSMRCAERLLPLHPSSLPPAGQLIVIGADRLCSTHLPLQSAAASLLAAMGARQPRLLPPLLSAVSGAMAAHACHLPAAADRLQLLERTCELLAPLLARHAVAGPVGPARALPGWCGRVDAMPDALARVQALGVVMLCDSCPCVRGAAVGMLQLAAPGAEAAGRATDRVAPAGEAGHALRGGAAPSGIAGRSSAGCTGSGCGSADGSSAAAAQAAADASPPEPASVFAVLQRFLSAGDAVPAVSAHRHPLDPPGRTQHSASRLRDAARRGNLRCFAEAVGGPHRPPSAGEAQLWLGCVHRLAASLAASPACVDVMAVAWTWLLERCPLADGPPALPYGRACKEKPPIAPWCCAASAACAMACALLTGSDRVGELCATPHARHEATPAAPSGWGVIRVAGRTGRHGLAAAGGALIPKSPFKLRPPRDHPGVLQRDSTTCVEKGVELLLRFLYHQLLSSCEAGRAAAGLALGQLRGPLALRLVLSELHARLLDLAAASDWGRDATANIGSVVHVHMRSVAQLLALLSAQPGWPAALVGCGARLGALAAFVHALLDYLLCDANRHAWSLQPTRLALAVFLQHTQATGLAALQHSLVPPPPARPGHHPPDSLRPPDVLDALARMLKASAASAADEAILREASRLLARAPSARPLRAELEQVVGGELRAQANEVRAAVLSAIRAIAASAHALPDHRDRLSEPGLVAALCAAQALLSSPSAVVAAQASAALLALRSACPPALEVYLQMCDAPDPAGVQPAIHGAHTAPATPPTLALAAPTCPNAHFLALSARAVGIAARVNATRAAPHWALPPVVDGEGLTADIAAPPLETELTDPQRASILLLALRKLSEPDPQVRHAALRLLHALGGGERASSTGHFGASDLPGGSETFAPHGDSATHSVLAPPTASTSHGDSAPLLDSEAQMALLGGPELLWAASSVQSQQSALLARRQPWLAPALIAEALSRAAAAPPAEAGAVIALLPPWFQHAARLAREPDMEAAVPGCSAAAVRLSLTSLLTDAQAVHMRRGDTQLAAGIHACWAALASCPAAVAAVLSSLLRRARQPASLSPPLLATLRAVFCSVSEAQPGLCASLMARRLAPDLVVGTGRVAAPKKKPPHPRRIMRAVLARGVQGFSAPCLPQAPQHGWPDGMAPVHFQFSRLCVHAPFDSLGASVQPRVCVPECAQPRVPTADRPLTHGEAVVLLLASAHPAALHSLVSDAAPAEPRTAPAGTSPARPARPAGGLAGQDGGTARPPPRAELLVQVLHAACLCRVTAPEHVRAEAGRLIWRMLAAMQPGVVPNEAAGSRGSVGRRQDGRGEEDVRPPPSAPPAAAWAALSHVLGVAPSEVTSHGGHVACSPAVSAIFSGNQWTGLGGSAGADSLVGASAGALQSLVSHLLLCLSAHGSVLASWASTALQHGVSGSRGGTGASSGIGVSGENSTPGLNAALGMHDPGVACASLTIYNGLTPALDSPLWQLHAEMLLASACDLALEPSAATVPLALQAVRAVAALLSKASTEAQPLAASLVSTVFWRGALLLHSDAILIYTGATSLLAALAAGLPPDCDGMQEHLDKTAPLHWSRGRFPGLLPLCLVGLSRQSSHPAALHLARTIVGAGLVGVPAWGGPEPPAALTACVALLPWLLSGYAGARWRGGARLRSGAGGLCSCGAPTATRLCEVCTARRLAHELAPGPGHPQGTCIPLATALQRYSSLAFADAADLARALRAGLSTQSGALSACTPAQLSPLLASLACSACSVEPRCLPSLYILTLGLLDDLGTDDHLAAHHGGRIASMGGNSLPPPCTTPAPCPQLWSSAGEAALSAPACVDQLSTVLDAYLAACVAGRLRTPTALLDGWPVTPHTGSAARQPQCWMFARQPPPAGAPHLPAPGASIDDLVLRAIQVAEAPPASLGAVMSVQKTGLLITSRRLPQAPGSGAQGAAQRGLAAGGDENSTPPGDENGVPPAPVPHRNLVALEPRMAPKEQAVHDSMPQLVRTGRPRGGGSGGLECVTGVGVVDAVTESSPPDHGRAPLGATDEAMHGAHTELSIVSEDEGADSSVDDEEDDCYAARGWASAEEAAPSAVLRPHHGVSITRPAEASFRIDEGELSPAEPCPHPSMSQAEPCRSPAVSPAEPCRPPAVLTRESGRSAASSEGLDLLVAAESGDEVASALSPLLWAGVDGLAGGGEEARRRSLERVRRAVRRSSGLHSPFG